MAPTVHHHYPSIHHDSTSTFSSFPSIILLFNTKHSSNDLVLFSTCTLSSSEFFRCSFPSFYLLLFIPLLSILMCMCESLNTPPTVNFRITPSTSLNSTALKMFSLPYKFFTFPPFLRIFPFTSFFFTPLPLLFLLLCLNSAD